MFVKLSALAVLLPLVSGLTLDTPTNVNVGGELTVTWTASTADPPYFNLELVNVDFHNTFAVANTVQTSLGTLTIELPQVPAEGGYTIQAFGISDVNDVLSESGDFSIGAAVTTSSTASSTSASSVSSASSSTGSLSSPSATATTPVSSGASSATGTGTSASSSPTTLSSGAGPLQVAGVLPAAALVLSVVAGVAMVF